MDGYADGFDLLFCRCFFLGWNKAGIDSCVLVGGYVRLQNVSAVRDTGSSAACAEIQESNKRKEEFFCVITCNMYCHVL